MVRPQFKRNGEIDRQLEDLVKASSWKQAIALCEKRIKKGDKSDAASIAKAHVLQACPDLGRQQQGTKDLERLISRDPPILDIEVLRSVHMFAVFRKGPLDNLGTPWVRAAKARPHEEKIIKAWFETMFDTRHYKDAQEAAIMYKTRFPHNHQAHFWYIITCQLLAESKESEGVVRKVNQGLVFGNLAKASKALTIAGGLPTNGLVLENLEDLLLLLRVYRSQGKFEEALNVLDDDRAGIFSRIGNKAWQLVRHKIELLELNGQWQELWQFCKIVLSGSHPKALFQKSASTNSAFGKMGDDWAIWSRLIIATNQICTDDTFSQAEACIDSFSVFSRNARIARLKLYASYPIESADIKAKLSVASQEHFTDFSTKYVCFLDLSPYLPSLWPEHKVGLINFAAQHTRSLTPGPNDPEAKAIQWITSEVNLLKLHYNLCVSKYPSNVARPLLDFFVCRCLRLYKLSLALDADLPISERRAGDDAAILAVMTLIHIWDLEEETALLRCVVILETLLERSPHNYDALLILIRLCVNIGTPSLAMSHYLQLSVKNMQNATLSWILYTRISMLHPYSYVFQPKNDEAATVINVSENITAALEWHAGAIQLNSHYAYEMLREGQHNMLLDALALENPLKVGFARLLLLVEWSRIQRLTGASSDVNYSIFLDDASGQVEDNRDTKVFPNYEWQSHSPFESRVEHSAPVDIYWLSYQLQIVNAWDILNGSEHINGEFVRDMCEADPRSIEHSSELEKTMIKTLFCGVQILASYKPGHKPEAAQKHIMQSLELLASFQEVAGQVLNYPSSEFKGLSTHLRPKFATPNASYLQHYFGIFDICHAIRRCVSCVMNSNEENKIVEPASLLRLSRHLVAGNKSIALKAESQASTMQRELRGERALRDTVGAAFDGHDERQDLIGEELQKTIGQPNMERIAECLCDSWIEALDGIVKAARYLSTKSDVSKAL